MIIGLTGRIAAGKGAIAGYFIDKGYSYIALSSVIREEAEKRGLPVERKILQDIGNEFRNKGDLGVWVRKAIEKMNNTQSYLIDGIRHPGEVAELRTKPSILISIDAPQKERFERMLKRNKSSDPKIFEEFLKLDNRDFCDTDPNGQQVGKCMEMADYTIINNSSYENLIKRLDEIYSEIRNKEQKRTC